MQRTDLQSAAQSREEFMPGRGHFRYYSGGTPSNGIAGFATGALAQDYVNGVLYQNTGTNLSAVWTPIATASTGNVTAGNVTYANNTVTAQTTANGAFNEIYTSLESTQGITIDVPLSTIRLLQADGSFGNSTQNGGILANDTTPNLSINGNGAMRIGIAASSAQKLQFQFPIPPDADPTGNMVISTLVVGGGTTNAFGVTYTLSVDGQAGTTANANLSTANTTPQVANATFPGSGNWTANSLSASVNVTQASHGTDAWFILGWRVTFKKKLLAA